MANPDLSKEGFFKNINELRGANSKQISLRMPEPIYYLLEREANDRQITVSQLIRNICDNYVYPIILMEVVREFTDSSVRNEIDQAHGDGTDLYIPFSKLELVYEYSKLLNHSRDELTNYLTEIELRRDTVDRAADKLMEFLSEKLLTPGTDKEEVVNKVKNNP